VALRTLAEYFVYIIHPNQPITSCCICFKLL